MRDMSKHNVQIEENVYCSVKEYCDINGMKIGPYISKLIQKGLNEDKFGNAPFLQNKRKDSAPSFLSSDDLADMINRQKEIITVDSSTGEIDLHTDKFDGEQEYIIPSRENETVGEKQVVKRHKIK